MTVRYKEELGRTSEKEFREQDAQNLQRNVSVKELMSAYSTFCSLIPSMMAIGDTAFGR